MKPSESVVLGSKPADASSSRDLTKIMGRLLVILKSAAYAVECESAILLLNEGSALKIVAASGKPVAENIVNGLMPRLVALGPEEVFSVDPGSAASGFSRQDVDLISRKGHMRYVVAARVDEAGVALGALLLFHMDQRLGLSPAQSFVLRMQAIQIADTLKPKSHNEGALKLEAVLTGKLRPERLRLLESVVVNANDAVLITEAEPIDLPGPRIVYCNPAFERTTGYTEAEILGKTPRLLQSKSIDRKALAKLKDALVNWRPVQVELLNVRKDGTEFWVEISIVPVADETGWYTHWVSIQRDISDRKRIEAQLFYEASHDRLTKLYNRAFFMDQLEVALREADGKGCNTLLFLDLDDFKLVNDSLGHNAGDFLLTMAAARLKDCIGPNHMLARLGGDEFAILMAGSGLQTGIEVADRIIKTLRQPITISNQNIFPSCSIGIAQSTGEPLMPADFLRNADIAMYEAKKAGLGGYVVFSDDMHESVSTALLFQTDLHQAVEQSGFHLVYQPIYDAKTSVITGIEALIRWDHSTRGLVSPMDFIPVAEQMGLIRSIDRWVLRTASLQLCRLNKRFGSAALRMSVNVSGDELRDDNFIPELRSLIRETRLDPTTLQLEITESVFLRHPEVIGKILADIRALGVRIALDDFGTGFSSLSYIDQYEIDTIKIDRSFVARMLTHRRTSVIIETIIRLGRALDLDIVAEGVETQQQLEALVGLECTHTQGFLLAKPMLSNDLIDVLQSAARQTTARPRVSPESNASSKAAPASAAVQSVAMLRRVRGRLRAYAPV